MEAGGTIFNDTIKINKSRWLFTHLGLYYLSTYWQNYSADQNNNVQRDRQTGGHIQ